MTLSLLVVDPELEVLGDLASGLRALGLEVAIADTCDLALERARARRPDVFVIERSLAEQTPLLAELGADRQLSGIPRFVMADAPSPPLLLDRRDPAALASGLYAVLPRERDAGGRDSDFRGDLSQVSVVDLLQLLSMNRRSGALSIVTARGAGEVRLRDGEIVDAVFRRQEGEKALYRLLAEEEGSFAFASGSETTLRRIEVPTSALLLEGVRQLDEVRQLRERLGSPDSALVSRGELAADLDVSELEREICRVLDAPRSLDELLEELGESDLQILKATERLLTAGHVRQVVGGGGRPELASVERAHLLAALVKRLGREGFGGRARLVLAGDVRRVAAAGHAAARLSEAELPASSLPLAPVPHVLVTLKLPDGARLELAGLPLAEEFGPLWGLSLPGSAAVVQLDDSPSPLLEELTAVLGIPLLSAPALLGALDETDSQQVAALVRSVLDQLVSA